MTSSGLPHTASGSNKCSVAWAPAAQFQTTHNRADKMNTICQKYFGLSNTNALKKVHIAINDLCFQLIDNSLCIFYQAIFQLRYLLYSTYFEVHWACIKDRHQWLGREFRCSLS